ncbi:hypothetical protein ABPG72_003914 [Tetrahymena utriculariae]
MGQNQDKDQIQQCQTLVVQTQGTLQLNYADQHLAMLEQLFNSMKNGIARQSELMDDDQKQTFERKIELQEGPNVNKILMFKFIVQKKKNYQFYLLSKFSVEDPLCQKVVHAETIYYDSIKQAQQLHGLQKIPSQNIFQEMGKFYLDMVNNIRCQVSNAQYAPPILQQPSILQQNQIYQLQQPQQYYQNQLQQPQYYQQNQQQVIPQGLKIHHTPQQIQHQQPQQYQQLNEPAPIQINQAQNPIQ